MLEDIERAGLCGKRILPPPDLSLSNLDQVVNVSELRREILF